MNIFNSKEAGGRQSKDSRESSSSEKTRAISQYKFQIAGAFAVVLVLVSAFQNCAPEPFDSPKSSQSNNSGSNYDPADPLGNGGGSGGETGGGGGTTPTLPTPNPSTPPAAKLSGGHYGVAILLQPSNSCTGPNGLPAISPASCNTISGSLTICCETGHKRLILGASASEGTTQTIVTCVYLGSSYTSPTSAPCTSIGLSQ